MLVVSSVAANTWLRVTQVATYLQPRVGSLAWPYFVPMLGRAHRAPACWADGGQAFAGRLLALNSIGRRWLRQRPALCDCDCDYEAQDDKTIGMRRGEGGSKRMKDAGQGGGGCQRTPIMVVGYHVCTEEYVLSYVGELMGQRSGAARY